MPDLKGFIGIEGTDFFEQDRGLQGLLERLLPESEREPVFSSLHDCARRVSGTWNALAQQGSRNEQLPRILKQDRVGRPIEEVELSPYVQQLRREVADFGVLTGARSDVHRFALIYLLAHNGEASLMCGTSCTDGLLRVLDAKGSSSLIEQYRERIASAATPMAGAQFITEQAGGSDVGAIESTAEPIGEGTWAITGEKWFCSNPQEYFVVAARPQGAPAGTKGVGLFFVPRVLPDGNVNHLSYRRLKDKLGTRSLPTAEIDFHGAVGFPLGEPSEGFHNLMGYVINTSRLHNASNALGFVHRGFLEARNYARQRDAFGGTIIRYPLVQEQLLRLLAGLTRERLLHFRLLALIDENGLVPDDREQELWQRCLINIDKYRTAVDLTACMRDAILLMGANGTVEDFGVLPRLYRDAIIIETWEGPHNTLALQLLRDFGRFDFLGRWNTEVNRVLDAWPKGFLDHTRQRLSDVAASLKSSLEQRAGDSGWIQAQARRLADGTAGVLSIAWLAEHAFADADRDAGPALLTALAADQLWGNEPDRLSSRLFTSLPEVAPALVDEEPVSPPAWLAEV